MEENPNDRNQTKKIRERRSALRHQAILVRQTGGVVGMENAAPDWFFIVMKKNSLQAMNRPESYEEVLESQGIKRLC